MLAIRPGEAHNGAMLNAVITKAPLSWPWPAERLPPLLIAVTLWLLAVVGLDVMPIPRWLGLTLRQPPGALICSSIVLLAALGIYYRVLRHRPAVFALAWAGLMILFTVIVTKLYWVYQYDFTANTITIRHYAETLRLPNYDMRGESHQAPLYYILAAIVYRLAEPRAGEPDCWYYVQELNFFFFAMFLLYSIVTLLKVIPSRFLATAGIAALLLWPGNILHIGRISNNILIYLSFMGCAYHFMGWHRDRSLQQLNLALIWMGVAFATQTSAVVLLASTVSLALLKDLWGKPLARWRQAALTPVPYNTHLKPLRAGLLIALIGISAGYGRNFYNYLTDSKVSVIFGTHTRSSVFIPSELFTLDVEKFIAYPYIAINPEQHSVNRQFFGYFLRSMSFGQFTWNGTQQAVIMNALILLMWCYLAGAMLYWRIALKRPLEWSGYFGVFLGYSVIAMASAKMLIHEWSYFWADVRYIYAIVPFFLLSYLYLLHLLKQAEKPRIYLPGLALILAYGGFSAFHLYLQLAPKE